MVSYLNELLDRVVAIQKEAMLSINIAADAWPYFYKTSESFPYFTNRIADVPITDDGSQDEDVNTPLVIMRLVVAHLTSGYKGEAERRLYEWMPVVKTTFNQRQWLTSNAYPVRMANLQEVRVINNGRFVQEKNDGIDATQVGVEIALRCVFVEYIEQDQY
jgi:hypothetical protein